MPHIQLGYFLLGWGLEFIRSLGFFVIHFAAFNSESAQSSSSSFDSTTPLIASHIHMKQIYSRQLDERFLSSPYLRQGTSASPFRSA